MGTPASTAEVVAAVNAAASTLVGASTLSPAALSAVSASLATPAVSELTAGSRSLVVDVSTNVPLRSLDLSGSNVIFAANGVTEVLDAIGAGSAITPTVSPAIGVATPRTAFRVTFANVQFTVGNTISGGTIAITPEVSRFIVAASAMTTVPGATNAMPIPVVMS